MIKVTCEIPVYEVDGQAPAMSGPGLAVRSHWNDPRMVVIETPNGEKVTVVARDLEAAIRNATNTSR